VSSGNMAFKKIGTTALFLGRFQPFHLGHLWVVKQLCQKHEKVIILVGTRQKAGEKNPFSYKERVAMIKLVMLRLGIKNYIIKGIADNMSDDAWLRNLRKIVPKNSIMYAGNNSIINLFRKNKFPVKRVDIYRAISGSKVRARIRNRQNWKKYVDTIVAEFLEKKHLLGKIRK